MNQENKRILMIATGGTIASKRSETGLKPLITSDELLSYVPAPAIFVRLMPFRS